MGCFAAPGVESIPGAMASPVSKPMPIIKRDGDNDRL